MDVNGATRPTSRCLSRVAALPLLSSCVALALLAALPATAQTSFLGSGDTDADVSAFGQIVDPPRHAVNRSGPAPVGTVISSTAALANGGAGALARAVGQTTATPAIGGLHLTAHSFSQVSGGDPASGELALSRADATAMTSDFFQLAVPGYGAGTLFTLSASIRIDAAASASGLVSNPGGPSSFETSAHWSSAVSLTPSIGGAMLADIRDSRTCAQTQIGLGCSGSDPGVRLFSFVMPNQSWSTQLIISGRARATLQVDIIGGGSGQALGHADLGHTIAWGGISGVLDPTGNPDPAFSAVSAGSGVDYSNAYVSAVPEPTTALQLLAGVGVLGWLRRQRPEAGPSGGYTASNTSLSS